MCAPLFDIGPALDLSHPSAPRSRGRETPTEPRFGNSRARIYPPGKLVEMGRRIPRELGGNEFAKWASQSGAKHQGYRGKAPHGCHSERSKPTAFLALRLTSATNSGTKVSLRGRQGYFRRTSFPYDRQPLHTSALKCALRSLPLCVSLYRGRREDQAVLAAASILPALPACAGASSL
jgi:hypothetical protein